MASKPRITVIIPTYNQASFLRGALRSVLSQTFSSWEAIVVNNHSEDNTEEVVASFPDSRIYFENFHNNGIIAASRNHGIGKARGDYIAFLDSDDWWYPKKLECCLAALCDSDAGAVCHAERWVGDNGYCRDVEYGPESSAIYRSLLFDGNCISTSAVMVDRCSLSEAGGFDESKAFVTAEDYDLWLRLAKAGTRFIFLPDLLGKYRIHSGGSSQSVMKNVRATLAVIERQFETIEAKGILDKTMARRARAMTLYGGGRVLQKQRERQQAFGLFVKAMREYPLISRLYIALLLNCVPDHWQRSLDR